MTQVRHPRTSCLEQGYDEQSLGTPFSRRKHASGLTLTTGHCLSSARSPKAGTEADPEFVSSLTYSSQCADWWEWNQRLRASVRRHRRTIGTREARRDSRPSLQAAAARSDNAHLCSVRGGGVAWPVTVREPSTGTVTAQLNTPALRSRRARPAAARRSRIPRAGLRSP